MTIKAIIVDDDLKSRELIHSFCKIYGHNKIKFDLCHSVDTTITSKENNKQLVLDIDMPKKNGFD
jgi:two-component system LytT family response regulator